MEDMAKVPGDVMKLEAHAHLFCSSLQFDLLSKAFASKKRKSETISEKIVESPGLRATRVRV